MVLVEVLHIRSVLEVVGVEIAAFNVLVRENVIGVFLDFEGVTLCCEVFLYKVENLGVRSRRCTILMVLSSVLEQPAKQRRASTKTSVSEMKRFMILPSFLGLSYAFVAFTG